MSVLCSLNLTVYLAGPMRGIPAYNFPAFHEAAAHLRSLGLTVYNPAEHDEESGFDPHAETEVDENGAPVGFDLEDAFCWDIERILESDAIVVLPGWENSSGAKLEVAVALKTGAKFYRYKALARGLLAIPRQPEVRVVIAGFADRLAG